MKSTPASCLIQFSKSAGFTGGKQRQTPQPAIAPPAQRTGRGQNKVFGTNLLTSRLYRHNQIMSICVSIIYRKLIYKMMVSRKYNPQPSSPGGVQGGGSTPFRPASDVVLQMGREPFPFSAAQKLRSPEKESSIDCAVAFSISRKTAVFRAGTFPAWHGSQPMDSISVLSRAKKYQQINYKRKQR